MILELIVAVSVPLWLGIEELLRLRRKRRHEARMAARKKSRQAALESLLSANGLTPAEGGRIIRAPGIRPTTAARSEP